MHQSFVVQRELSSFALVGVYISLQCQISDAENHLTDLRAKDKKKNTQTLSSLLLGISTEIQTDLKIKTAYYLSHKRYKHTKNLTTAT